MFILLARFVKCLLIASETKPGDCYTAISLEGLWNIHITATEVAVKGVGGFRVESLLYHKKTCLATLLGALLN